MSLRAAYLALHRRADACLARRGVTADQFVVLATLAEGEALSQRELVGRTSSDPSTLRAMLVLLERKGLVERRPHPTDRRARRVALTPKGRRALDRSWAASEPLRQQLLAPLTTREAERLISLLERITPAG
jgi:DNA-binding MarR family transcriptional regulator